MHKAHTHGRRGMLIHSRAASAATNHKTPLDRPPASKHECVNPHRQVLWHKRTQQPWHMDTPQHATHHTMQCIYPPRRPPPHTHANVSIRTPQHCARMHMACPQSVCVSGLTLQSTAAAPFECASSLLLNADRQLAVAAEAAALPAAVCAAKASRCKCHAQLGCCCGRH